MEAADFILLVLGGLLGYLISLFIIWKYKPKIEISNPRFAPYNENQDVLKIDISNKLQSYKAIGLNVEMCVLSRGYTYHYDVEKPQAIMLLEHGSPQGQDSRTFCAYDLAKFTSIEGYTFNRLKQELEAPNINSYLRVRVYANHSFTGYGDVFQKYYKRENNVFIPVPENEVTQ